MNPTTLALLALGAYLLWKQGILGGPQAPTRVYTSTPAGTTVAVPGVGRYTSGPGGTQVALDPSFLSRLIGRGTGEQLPAFGPGPDSPVWPAGTQSATWALGGALDSYRAGERDPVLSEDTLPLTVTEDANVLFPQDVAPEDVTWWYESAEFLT